MSVNILKTNPYTQNLPPAFSKVIPSNIPAEQVNIAQNTLPSKQQNLNLQQSATVISLEKYHENYKEVQELNILESYNRFGRSVERQNQHNVIDISV